MQVSGLQGIWQSRNLYSACLFPLSLGYRAIIEIRSWLYKRQFLKSQRLTVPVIVVGNITVGGTGKTPLVNWLAWFLQESGYRPGIISRGYKGKATQWPQVVRPDSGPQWVGDEAVLLARNSRCPVVVGPDRIEAANKLLTDYSCNVLISDDGLQHLKLARDMEISMVDGDQRYGNEWLLPAGPLRESKSRLNDVDVQVCLGQAESNELAMSLTADSFRLVNDPDKEIALADLEGTVVHAVAAIGNPQRFFGQLRKLGLQIIEHPFDDHHWFKPEELVFSDNAYILMTEKDAVKCELFATEKYLFLPVKAKLDPALGEMVLKLLSEQSPTP